MEHLPSDRALLEAIHTLYHDAYHQEPQQGNVVRIDLPFLARHLRLNELALLEVLYYRFNNKYALARVDADRRLFVRLEEGYAVDFPLLVSVLAELRGKQRRRRLLVGALVLGGSLLGLVAVGVLVAR